MKCAVVMTTCHGYRDAWEPFFKLFEKYWPDCPYDKIVAADYPNEQLNWRWLTAPPMTSWCKTTLNVIQQIKSKYILLFQEDFFLNAPVDSAGVQLALDFLEQTGGDIFRLYPCPGPDIDIGCEKIGRINSDADYAVSCQATIWKRDYLISLLEQFETPLQFEMEGTKYIKREGANLFGWKREATPWPLQYICTAIVKGCWTGGAIELCQHEGIPLDLSLRPVGERS